MFVELKCRTNFSFLTGASSADELIARAVTLGYDALAITDLNGVYALPRALEAVLAHQPEFKLICGAELRIEQHPNITLLARNRKGYGILCRLLTKAHADKPKGEARLTLMEICELLAEQQYDNELFCIPDLNESTDLNVLRELFKDNLYLPLCRYLDGLDEERTGFMLQKSREFNLPFIATNDVHYHVPARRPLQDCLTCIRAGKTVESAGFELFGNEERYLKSDLQMRALFSDLPEAINNSEKIAAACSFHLSELKYRYPAEFIPPGHTAQSYLRELVFKGAFETYKGLIPENVDRQIKRELDFFAKRRDEHYFLTVYDIVRFAKENNIICQGLGSAANSVVCYVLGITAVDPVQMNLLFDRFMNDGRIEPPDIDIDFEHERREEVIQYIYKRFGRERAAMVAAVRTYRSKSALLELSKALGIEVGTLSAAELQEKFNEIAKDKCERIYFIAELAKQLRKFPRHLSIHSGGFVLSDEPLVEMVPIEPARMPGRTIIQWDKDDLETLGLMKIDVLSIGFLSALHKASDLAQIDWRDIPAEDPKTYKMIQRSETHGTFQIESRAQMSMLAQTLPQNYYDLVVQVALVRPSPTVGGMVQPFIKGLFAARAGRPFKIGNEKLEKILGRTYGVPVFQEQVMQISIDVAGFTAAEADKLRRSLGNQRTAANVSEMGQKLYDSLVKAGISVEFADKLFNYIKGYAHYGFPESHAASYALLAYKSAYMKCHYPAELVCALINSQPMGFYSVDSLIAEARRNGGVTFLPVHPNKSVWDCTLEEKKTVRMGFRSVRKIRKEDVVALVAERERKQFISMEDFIARTDFDREVLENMSMADVFCDFGLDRRHSFWKSAELTKLIEKRSSEQLSFFNEEATFASSVDIFRKMSLLDEISADHSRLGYSLHGNMMKALRLEVANLPKLVSTQVKRLPHGRNITYAGILSVLQRPPPAKGTAFITLEDEFGSVDCILRKEIYEKYSDVISGSRFLIFTGKIQSRGAGRSLVVAHVESFSRTRAAKPIGPMQYDHSLHWTSPDEPLKLEP